MANGFATNDLVIRFNSKVTPAVAQQVVRAITFKTVGGSAGTRTLSFTLSDGDGGVSAKALKRVEVKGGRHPNEGVLQHRNTRRHQTDR